MTAKERIGLVGCVKSKRPGSAPARDLYTSPLFRGRKRWVERTCDRWFVLSALHGLVEPARELPPYDTTLKDASVAERYAWSDRVLRDLQRTLGNLRDFEFEIHAGREYAEFGLESGLLSAGAIVGRPAEGLGLGEQLSLYAGTGDSADRQGRSSYDQRGAIPPGRRGGGKYVPLGERLAADSRPVEMTFEQIEALVGPLPASARKHRTWWANDQSHVQALAWLSLGRMVESVDFPRERVLFGAAPRRR